MSYKPITLLLWLLAIALVLVILSFASLPTFIRDSYLLYAGAGILLVGGGLLLYFTLKNDSGKSLKFFLLLTGGSAVGIPVFVILHNLAYLILAKIMDVGAGDEPFFFVLATIVCPLGLITGLVGSVIQRRKRIQPAE